jgi:two-component sensor histidine kinase
MIRLPPQVRLYLLVATIIILAFVAALIVIGPGTVASVPRSVLLGECVILAAALVAAWFVVRAWWPEAAAPGEPGAVAPRHTEQALRADLAQRDLLLREIHHRVKNNLQMISSLLSLQAERIRSPRLRRAFSGARNRVLTMAVLHRHLYERTNWAEVDFQAFLNDLVRHLSSDNGARGGPEVRFYLNAPVLATGPDAAIPVGLIITEAISNALTHAFRDTPDPRITVRIRDVDGTFDVLVEDNGSGIAPHQTESTENDGLGFMLLRGLTAQLGGSLDIRRRAEGGTGVHVSFPSPRPTEAVNGRSIHA